MANSYSQTTQTLSQTGTTVLQSCLAPLAAFTTPIEIQPIDLPALTSQVPIATAAAATASGANLNYDTGDCTITNIQLAHTRYAQNFGLSGSDLNNGARLEWLAELNARALAQTITDAVMTLVTTANFGAAVSSVTSGNFAVSDFETLAGSISAHDRAMVLAPAYFVKVKNTWMPPGNLTVHELNRWTSAGTKINGLVATPRAIVLRHGIPMMPAVEVVDRTLMELPDIGIIAETALWFQPASRSLRATYGLYFGAAVADANALKILATP